MLMLGRLTGLVLVVALGTSLESFRNNDASATNMPVDLVHGSVGTNSVQVVPINEVVASLTSKPIGLPTQPYARACTSYSPTFNGESDDNHEEERESQGDTQEDSTCSGCPNPDLDNHIQIWTSDLGREEVHAVTSPSSKPIRDVQIQIGIFISRFGCPTTARWDINIQRSTTKAKLGHPTPTSD
jgi:hypothetical protein